MIKSADLSRGHRSRSLPQYSQQSVNQSSELAFRPKEVLATFLTIIAIGSLIWTFFAVTGG